MVPRPPQAGHSRATNNLAYDLGLPFNSTDEVEESLQNNMYGRHVVGMNVKNLSISQHQASLEANDICNRNINSNPAMETSYAQVNHQINALASSLRKDETKDEFTGRSISSEIDDWSFSIACDDTLVQTVNLNASSSDKDTDNEEICCEERQANDFSDAVHSDSANVDAVTHMINKTSDALTFGPKFRELFTEYQDYCHASIDVSRHLLSLCLDNLVSFSLWAREDDNSVSRISSMLQDHELLRPEVRNGFIMVLMYTFSSIKAMQMENSDMFTVLQDFTYGFGIANKFSLRIYNDPLHYFYFLKICLSSLIEAGVIPENERLNQKRATKSSKCNKFKTLIQSEKLAFLQLKAIITTLLDNDHSKIAENVVLQVTSAWRDSNKKTGRFGTALQALRSCPMWHNIDIVGTNASTCDDICENEKTSEALSYSISENEGRESAALKLSNENLSVCQVNMNESISGSHSYGCITSNMHETIHYQQFLLAQQQAMSAYYTTHLQVIPNDQMTELLPQPICNSVQIHEQDKVILQADLVNNIKEQCSGNQSTSEQIKRKSTIKLEPKSVSKTMTIWQFDKIGQREWDVREQRLCEYHEFLNVSMNDSRISSILLVDEQKLRQHVNLNSTKFYGSQQKGTCQLESEFSDQCDSLLAVWRSNQFYQLREFLHRWKSSDHSRNILDFWNDDKVISRTFTSQKRARFSMKPNSKDSNSNGFEGLEAPSTEISNGIFVIEYTRKCGIILRANPKYDIPEDLWCMVYEKEVDNFVFSHEYMLCFLCRIFPQLAFIPQISNLHKDETIEVKYSAHYDLNSEINSVGHLNRPPEKLSPSNYRVIGSLTTPIELIVARLDHQPIFHDFTFS